ncbi:MAG: HAMP domain-containing histidine kinase [Clostridiales bacterium]|nr:HAMP domain-containing histidine kinase [Clostridiales bacterium]
MEKKKKQFFRTIPGKTLLFLVINLLAIIFFGCICASVACIQEDLYNITEEEFYQTKDDSNVYYDVIDQTEYLIGIDNYHVDNMSIRVTGKDGKLIASTRDFDDVSQAAGKSGEFQNYKLYTYDIKLVYGENGEYKHSHDRYSEPGDIVVDATVEAYTDPVLLSQYSAFDRQVIHFVIGVRYAVYPVALLCLIAGIAAFIALMCVAGKRPGTEEVFLGPVGKVPFDILAAVTLFITFGLFLLSGATSRQIFEVLIFAFAFFSFLNAMLGLCVSLSARIKLHMLIKGSFVYKFFKLIIKGILAVPLVWRTIIILGSLSFLELIVIVGTRADSEAFVIGWFLEKLVLYPFILYIALMLRKLKISGEKIAKGDISYRTSTKGLWGDFRKHAVNLNSVADSVTLAVDEKLKSERMKTELITNVSHDIKTPLTSIINYASLIGNADPSDPKLNEYSEVIVRQSEKLKRLIEDLVEASKASSGNLEIVPAPLDCCMFVSQTAGEFKEKLESANLSLITTAPEGPVMIMADGRRMMRIYDNLMNNICKYAQPGTRVYLTLEAADGKAVTTFKNTSSAELNISAEELVERFVRGDASRNTEGNGLGLSIAKSMTELQGGTFDISIDGDLFKVTLSFPISQPAVTEK